MLTTADQGPENETVAAVTQHEHDLCLGVETDDAIGAFETPLGVLWERCIDGAIGRAIGAPALLAHDAAAPVGRVTALVAAVRLPRGVVGRALLEGRGGARVVNVLDTHARVAREGIRGSHGAVGGAVCEHLAILRLGGHGAESVVAHVAANHLRRLPVVAAPVETESRTSKRFIKL